MQMLQFSQNRRKRKKQMIHFSQNQVKHQGNNAENMWVCSSCQSAIETQDHVLFCPAYAQLREGKSLDSDKDLSDYLMKVLVIREKLNISK